MRAFLAAAACLLLAGCGSTAPGAETEAPDSPVSGPSARPPSLEGEGPPPAWVETKAGGYWLAYSTFCWKGLCLDYVMAPEAELPIIPVEENELVRFHLGFEASEITFQPAAGPSVELDPADPTWTVEAGGAFTLFAVAAPGEEGSDASYAAVFETGS